MDVVTYLTSALLVAVSLALVVLGFRFDVRLRRRRHAAGKAASAEGLAPGEGMPIAALPAVVGSGIPSLDGFGRHYDPVEEDLHVYARLALFGPVTRPVVVHNGGYCLLFGPCVASITVRAGGAAVVCGLVTGDLVNEGGEIHVHGKVLGVLRRQGGHTVVHPLASVLEGGTPGPALA